MNYHTGPYAESLLDDRPREVDTAAEYERRVVGAVLQGRKSAVPAAREALPNGDSFYDPRLALVYDAALAVADAGGRPDPLTVGDYLERTDPTAVVRVGGHSEIHSLALDGITADPGWYAERVRDAHRVRLVDAAGRRLSQLADGIGISGETDVLDAVESARRFLDEAAAELPSRRVKSHAETLREVFESLWDTPTAIPTGWASIDHEFAGWERGAVTVVAARPGEGKTIFGLNAAVRAAERKAGSVIFVALEMNADEIYKRLLAMESGVNLANIVRGHLSADDSSRLAAAVDRLEDLPLVVVDPGGMTIPELRAVIEGQQAEGAKSDPKVPVDLVVIDHLGLFTASSTARNAGVRHEIDEMSRAVKMAAKALKVPVLEVHQLNRESAKRGEPTMTDLRDSGAVEMNADNVFLLYRDPDKPGEVQLICAKQRQGPTFRLGLADRRHVARFDDLAVGWDA